MQFQTAYGKIKKPKITTGEGLTEQAHADECDINLILADYKRTGLMKHVRQNEGRYDDVTALDFEQAMITVANVKSMFETLPSETRAQFGNDPSHFLNFVQNPQNGEILAQMGILKGNDGIDVSGAPTRAPTTTSVQNKAEANEAPSNGAQALTEPTESPKGGDS